MTDETVFGKAVDEFHKMLVAMAGSLAAACDGRRDALYAAAGEMICQAAEEAIKKFRAEITSPPQ